MDGVCYGGYAAKKRRHGGEGRRSDDALRTFMYCRKDRRELRVFDDVICQKMDKSGRTSLCIYMRGCYYFLRCRKRRMEGHDKYAHVCHVGTFTIKIFFASSIHVVYSHRVFQMFYHPSICASCPSEDWQTYVLHFLLILASLLHYRSPSSVA